MRKIFGEGKSDDGQMDRQTDKHNFLLWARLSLSRVKYNVWLSLNLILYTSCVVLYSVVCLSGIGNTQPNLHFFQYIQGYKPFADPVPPNTYQLILTKYQPVSTYTDPVPSSTTYNLSSRKAQFSQLNNFSCYASFDESRTVYLV